MSKFMEEESFCKDLFYKNILNDVNTFRDHRDIPIELEYTTLGSTFYNLRDCIFGNDALHPWTRVAFRIIQQMANVLQHLDPLSLGEHKPDVFYSHIASMTESLKVGFVQRIKWELGIWYEETEMKFDQLWQNNSEFYKKVKVQHQDFANHLYFLW